MRFAHDGRWTMVCSLSSGASDSLSLYLTASLARCFQEPRRVSECLSGAVFGRARRRALYTDGRAGAGTSTSSGWRRWGSEVRGAAGAGGGAALGQAGAQVPNVGARRRCREHGGAEAGARGVMVGEGEKGGGGGRAERREEVKQKGQRRTG